jgi:hypothetical protein
MTEALSLKLDYFIVGSVHARRVCRKMGFWERDPLIYYWLDPSGMTNLNPIVWIRRGFRKFLRMLRIKKHIEIISPLSVTLSNVAAPFTRSLFSSRLEQLAAELSSDFIFKEVEQIHAEPAIPPHLPEVELHRGVEAVNWMLTFPWVVESGSSVTEHLDYYFSDARPMYKQIAVEVYDLDDQYIGYVIFSASQHGEKAVLKTRDFRFAQPSYERAVLALALSYGRVLNAVSIELPMEITAHLPGKLPKILLQPKERIYQCMPKSDDSPLAQLWNEVSFHLWDGDMAFS